MYDQNFLIPSHTNHHNNKQMCKLNASNLNHSTDLGYDSLLSTSLNNSSLINSNSNCTRSFLFANYHDSVLHETSQLSDSPPPSSSKFSFQFNATTTPDFKQTYVADVGSLYYASLSANSKQANVDNVNSLFTCLGSLSTASPFKAPNSSRGCASNSSSPHSKSPQQMLSVDGFVHERDNLASKLLRSPAFKINGLSPAPLVKQAYSSSTHETKSFEKTPVFVSSFSSRLNSYTTTRSAKLISNTEADFMQFLIKDKLVPDNPHNLIGRHMGLDNLDILSELSERNVTPALDKIYACLSVRDLVSVGCVSKAWRNILKQEKRLYAQRAEYIRARQRAYETSKENRNNDSLLNLTDVSRSSLSADEKRSIFKQRGLKSSQLRSTIGLSKDLDESSSLAFSRNHNGSFVFASLDLNCLNNELNKSTQSLASNLTLTDDKTPSQTINLHEKRHKMMMASHKAQSLYETTACSTNNNSQPRADLFSRLTRLSPAKCSSTSPRKTPRKATSTVSTTKIELIGSKKSKKNLKRL